MRIASRLLTALKFSAENVLDRRVLERQVRVHALQLHVLRLELTQPFQFRHAGPCVLRFAVVVGGGADAVLARQLRQRNAGFPFFQDRNDLRLGKPRLLHETSLELTILPEKSSYRCLP